MKLLKDQKTVDHSSWKSPFEAVWEVLREMGLSGRSEKKGAIEARLDKMWGILSSLPVNWQLNDIKNDGFGEGLFSQIHETRVGSDSFASFERTDRRGQVSTVRYYDQEGSSIDFSRLSQPSIVIRGERYLPDLDSAGVSEVCLERGVTTVNMKLDRAKQSYIRYEVSEGKIVKIHADDMRSGVSNFVWDSINGGWSKIPSEDGDHEYPGKVYGTDGKDGIIILVDGIGVDHKGKFTLPAVDVNSLLALSEKIANKIASVAGR